MATKRFTDAEKWKDPFFENLTNDYKLIWLYLLDDCDNAGMWHKSLKRLNFNCNTNISEEDLLKALGQRLQPLTDDIWLIPKFLEFQYGVNWKESKNKAVISAKNKLKDRGVLIEDNTSIDTLSIPYTYSIDTAKDKDKVKGKDNYKEKYNNKELIKEEDIVKARNYIHTDIASHFDAVFKDV